MMGVASCRAISNLVFTVHVTLAFSNCLKLFDLP